MPLRQGRMSERRTPKVKARFRELAAAADWEYVVLVTNDESLDAAALSQAYRDRADCENVFDERSRTCGRFHEPPRHNCGAVERRAGLGAHPVGRILQMATRKGASPVTDGVQTLHRRNT